MAGTGGLEVGSGEDRDRADDLVFALCHEIGNLVAAIRLNADLVDAEASPVELAAASVEIDDSSARIRSWLALVRPLLGRENGEEPGVSPAALLAGIGEALEEFGGRGVEVGVEAEEGLSRVRGRPETLHHLIATLAYHAVEEARPRGRVRVQASACAGGVAIVVEDDGPEDLQLSALSDLSDQSDASGGGALTGRGLARVVAAHVLACFGGGARSERRDGRTRVVLELPLLQ